MKYKIPKEFLQKGSFPLMPQRIFRQQKLFLPLTLPTLYAWKKYMTSQKYLLLYEPFMFDFAPDQLYMLAYEKQFVWCVIFATFLLWSLPNEQTSA